MPLLAIVGLVGRLKISNRSATLTPSCNTSKQQHTRDSKRQYPLAIVTPEIFQMRISKD